MIKKITTASWIFEPSGNTPDHITLQRFTLPVASYHTLGGWQQQDIQQKHYRNLATSGLAEMLSYNAPQIVYMENKGNRFNLYRLVGDASTEQEEEAIRKNISRGIRRWLMICFPGHSEEHEAIAGTASDEHNWEQVKVPTGTKEAGECAVPEDDNLFSALLATAITQLAGKQITFARQDENNNQKQTSILIACPAFSGTFNGIELVVFPPLEKKGKDGNTEYYTEVINLKTATFPGRKQQGVHLLAHLSMRNWRKVKKPNNHRNDPSRSLDIFIPPRPGNKAYRHTNIKFKAKWEPHDKRLVARWHTQPSRKIHDVLQPILLGHTGNDNALTDFLTPSHINGGAYILPRAAPGSGDQYLAGGSGLPWEDRNAIIESIDQHLAEIGYRRCEDMQRDESRLPAMWNTKALWDIGMKAQEKDKNAAQLQHRPPLHNALMQNNQNKELNLLVLYLFDKTPQQVADEIKHLLGSPSDESVTEPRDTGAAHQRRMSWNDEIVVNIIALPAGPFAKKINLKPTREQEDKEPSGQIKQITRAQQLRKKKAEEEAEKEAEAEMKVYLETKYTTVGKHIGCAIIEMHEGHVETPGDPYRAARRALAKHKLLPQVVLVKLEQNAAKYHSAVADTFRMLGVMPFAKQAIADTTSNQHRPHLAAIGMLQVNNNSKGRQTLPVAVKVINDKIWAAIPNVEDTGKIKWHTYADVVLNIMQIEKYINMSTDKLFIAKFVRGILMHLNDEGETMIILDAQSLRYNLEGLQNKHLTYDLFDTGVAPSSHVDLPRKIEPRDLPNLCLLRFNSKYNEFPFYSLTNPQQWIQGLFFWGKKGGRVSYSAKSKPPTSKDSRANLYSRHEPDAENNYDNKRRQSSELDEVCILFMGSETGNNCTPEKLLQLVYSLHKRHVQFAGDTRAPFPLHELNKLKTAIMPS